MALVAGCSSQPGLPPPNIDHLIANTDVSTISGRAAVTAAEQIGTPYRYGGTTPKGFDCSGLVYYSYKQAGLAVPRTSAAQFSAVERIELRNARPGDLLFFQTGRSVDHVAIYVGNGTFVHAPKSGRTVTVAEMSNPYYREHFVAAGRIRNSN